MQRLLFQENGWGVTVKLAILSRIKGLYATSRLVDTARQRGHSVRVLDPLRCGLYMGPDGVRMTYKQRSVHGYHGVIPRIGHTISRYGVAVLRQFQAMGVYTPNSPQSVLAACDKLCTHQLLTAAAIPMPATIFADHPDDRQDLLAWLGASPYIVKLTEASQGVGVMLAESTGASSAVVDALHSLHACFLMQRFIAEANGCDRRCFVIGDRVVASMTRKAQPGEFRSNLSLGGAALPALATATEEDLAVRAAAVLGLAIAGVDLIQTSKGPMVLEVNASPGLSGIEQASGVDIASLIIRYLETHCPFEL